MSPLVLRGGSRFKIEVFLIQENKSTICEHYITLTHSKDRLNYRLKEMHAQRHKKTENYKLISIFDKISTQMPHTLLYNSAFSFWCVPGLYMVLDGTP